MNISRRLSSCLIFATVFARAWIFCAALACLGCGRPTSPGAGGGERGGCPGRSTRGPAGEHCAGLLAGGPLGRPVRNATADDSMSSTPLIAARPRRAVPRAILFGDEIVPGPLLVLRVFLQCAFVPLTIPCFPRSARSHTFFSCQRQWQPSPCSRRSDLHRRPCTCVHRSARCRSATRARGVAPHATLRMFVPDLRVYLLICGILMVMLRLPHAVSMPGRACRPTLALLS